jgi:hypothetical protein
MCAQSVCLTHSSGQGSRPPSTAHLAIDYGSLSSWELGALSGRAQGRAISQFPCLQSQCNTREL